MKKRECPVGTVVTLGHPANRILAVKGKEVWRYVETGEPIDYDTYHKSQWDIYAMPASCPEVSAGTLFRCARPVGHEGNHSTEPRYGT